MQGCLELLDRAGVQLSGKRAVVVGRSNIVGTPAAQLLQVGAVTPECLKCLLPHCHAAGAAKHDAMEHHSLAIQDCLICVQRE